MIRKKLEYYDLKGNYYQGDESVFIYILNLLNDGLKKKNNIYEKSAFEIIKDTKYILELGFIKKSFDFKNVSDKLVNVFEILKKYNLSVIESIGILNILITNKNNSWILDFFYNGDSNNKNDVALELALNSIINKEFEKNKKEKEERTNKLLKEIRYSGFDIVNESRITREVYYKNCVL
jgi:hypothetical protein